MPEGRLVIDQNRRRPGQSAGGQRGSGYEAAHCDGQRCECASHAVVDAEMGGIAGKGSGEQALARRLYRRLEPDWLLIADRNFYNWADWGAAADSGPQFRSRGGEGGSPRRAGDAGDRGRRQRRLRDLLAPSATGDPPRPRGRPRA